MKEEIDKKLNSLLFAGLWQHKNSAEKIETILLNIEKKIKGALSGIIGTVGWKVIVELVVDGPMGNVTCK